MLLLLIVFIPNSRKKLRSLYNFGGKYIYANSDISVKNHQLCNQMAIDLFVSSIKVNCLVIFSLLCAIGAPMYKILYIHEKELPIPIVLPFTNADTKMGFSINVSYQVVTEFFGLIIVPAGELVTCVLKNNISVSAAVIKNRFKEMKCRIKTDKRFLDQLNCDFRNAILTILDFDRLV